MLFSKKSLVVLVLTLLYSTVKVYAQEPNFSLYEYTPFFTNPGSIGTIEDVRLMLNYRNQAIEVSENFMSTTLSGYYPIYLGNHRLVVAGNFLNDQVSDFVNTNGGLLGVAYSIRLTASSELSFGAQGGYFQRKTAGNFTTDDQFVNGGFDPNAVSGDALINQSKSYPTLSTGIYYLVKDEQGREKAFVGGSVFNVTQPNISFIDSNADNLQLSIKATAGYKVYQGLKWSVTPTSRWVNQAGHNFFNVGSRFGYELMNAGKANQKIDFGIWYNSNDLGIFSVAYEQPNFTVGASYDLPFASKLASAQTGIFELAISLRIKKKSKQFVSTTDVTEFAEPLQAENFKKQEEIIQDEESIEEEELSVIKEEKNDINEPIIEEKRLDVVSLNKKFSHSDYLIRFEHASGSHVISDNQQKVIDEVTQVLRENPDLNVLIVGHASSVGGMDVNQKISEERSESISRILTSKGIASSRITTEGRGESEPIEDNSIANGASENRRVQIIFRVEN